MWKGYLLTLADCKFFFAEKFFPFQSKLCQDSILGVFISKTSVFIFKVLWATMKTAFRNVAGESCRGLLPFPCERTKKVNRTTSQSATWTHFQKRKRTLVLDICKMLGVQSNLCQTPMFVCKHLVQLLGALSGFDAEHELLDVQVCSRAGTGPGCLWGAYEWHCHGRHSGVLLWHAASPAMLVSRGCASSVWCQCSLLRRDKAPFWWRGREKGMCSWMVFHSSLKWWFPDFRGAGEQLCPWKIYFGTTNGSVCNLWSALMRKERAKRGCDVINNENAF